VKLSIRFKLRSAFAVNLVFIGALGIFAIVQMDRAISYLYSLISKRHSAC